MKKSAKVQEPVREVPTKAAVGGGETQSTGGDDPSEPGRSGYTSSGQ
ncbi:MAG TPA: hypothetical protein VN851_07870 [Thermoanaerobaculia bacterium]|nr:hypothetical protein [Thermoanaerobaculia bacterium]